MRGRRRLQQMVERGGGLRRARARAVFWLGAARFSSATSLESSLSYSLMRSSRCVPSISLKLLIFSDIHNDWKTLERLLAVEADFYIAAGDQVTWAKGLDRCGEILQTRGDRVYVLPGNHESAAQVAGMCARFGLHDFHGSTPGRAVARRRTGVLQPDALQHAGRIHRGGTRGAARAASPAWTRWCWSATLRRTARRSTRSGPACTPGRGVREFIEKRAAGVFLLRPHSRGGGRGDRDGQARARWNVGKKGVFVRIGLNPHDIGRVTARIPAPPRPGVCRAEVSLTPPPSNRN